MPSAISISIAALALLLIGGSVRVVRTDTVGVVKRWGRFHAIRSPGLRFVLPFIDRVRMVDMRGLTSPQLCPAVTRDGVAVVVDATLERRVVDPRLAVFGVSDYVVAVDLLFLSSLRALLSDMKLDDCQREREQIAGRLMRHMEPVAGRWGVRIERVDIHNIVRDPRRQARVDRAEPSRAPDVAHEQYLASGFGTQAAYEAGESIWMEDEFADMAAAENAARRWLAGQSGEARVEIAVVRPDGEVATALVTRTGIEWI